uniref:Uncharacterized protein n=1 Tax=Medicago truncatula TaxID=3880 RepID=I3SZ54_MEDTR|nr:unknown [Medicago truncatula]
MMMNDSFNSTPICLET